MRPVPEDHGDRSLSGRCALVVGSDPALQAVCAIVLAGLGISPTVATTGVAAVVQARRRPPDVLLVDGQLADVPGHQAATWLRSNPALGGRPLVLLVEAGSAVPGIAAAQPVVVLRKPVSEDDLRAVLISLIGEPGDGA